MSRAVVVRRADVVVGRPGDQPWVAQARGCGVEGEQLNIPYTFLQHNSSTRTAVFAKEWLKYKYGVFQESGCGNDTLYPASYMEGTKTVENSGCAENTEMFCTLGSHYNRIAPTKQNILCRGRSAREIILEGHDLQEDDDYINTFKVPSFRYVEQVESVFVLVLDISSSMELNNRWTYIKKALFMFIQLLDEGAILSIVTFGETASLVLPATLVTDDKRGGLYGRIPRRVLASNESCVECGLKVAQDILQRTGGNIVLISGKSPQLSNVIMENRDSSNQLFILSYDLDTTTPFGNFPLFYPVQANDDQALSTLTESLLDIFNRGKNDNNPVQKLFKDHHSVREFAGTFVIEEDLRNEIMVTLSIDDEQKVEYFEVSDPAGKRHIFSSFEDGLVIFKFRGAMEPGLWSYRTKLYPGAEIPAESMEVNVLAKGSHDSVTVEILSNGGHEKNPNTAPVLYAKVEKGSKPVVNANVRARLSGPDGSIEIRLQDRGTGYPDITPGDGIYSAYVPPFSLLGGAISVRVIASDGDGTSFTTQNSQKCGGEHTNIEHTGKFQRFIAGPSIFSRPLSPGMLDMSPPSRISDLRLVESNMSSMSVLLRWSSPGGDYDLGKAATYHMRYHTSLTFLNESNFEEKSFLVHLDPPLVPLEYGETQQTLVPVPCANKVVYFAVTAFDESGNRGPVSNIVAAYIQQEISSTTTTTTSNLGYDDQVLVEDHNSLVPGTNQVYLIGGCVVALVLVMIILATLALRIVKNKEKDEKLVEAVDSYQPGFDPDLNIKKHISGSSGGIYSWLDTISSQSSDSNTLDKSLPKTFQDVSLGFEICSGTSASFDSSPSKYDHTDSHLVDQPDISRNEDDYQLEESAIMEENYTKEIMFQCKQYYTFRDPKIFRPSLDIDIDHQYPDWVQNLHLRNKDDFCPLEENFCQSAIFSGHTKENNRKHYESIV